MFAEVLKLNKTLKEIDISGRIYKKCECDLEEVDEAISSALEINTTRKSIFPPDHSISVNILHKICNSLKMNRTLTHLGLCYKLITDEGVQILGSS
jgi:hypothetical protein